MSTLLIRADADEKIGTGHVMRCLALAQAWQDSGGEAIFVMNPCSGVMLPRLHSEGIEAVILSCDPGSGEDARATTKLAQEKAAKWIVVDGYCFGAEYQKLVKDGGFSLLFVDDNAHADHYCADLVLNQNLHACEEMYAKRELSTRMLLGPRHVLLRREFFSWREWKRDFQEKATKLLVTLGGADSENITSKVISAIEELELPEVETKVVVGPVNRSLPELQASLRRSRRNIALLTEQVDMPALMMWADVALAGAGSTSWELCFMGVPSLLIVVAENQRRTAEELAKRRAAVNLGPNKSLTSQEIREQLQDMLSDARRRHVLGERAQGVVDGAGAARVVTYLRASSLKMRRAELGDCRLLWEWANEPEVRASAFSGAPIPWEQHLSWFIKKLGDPQTLMFVGIDAEGEPVGQIRFEMDGGGDAVVDVSVSSQHRKLGYGTLLISQGVEALSGARHVNRIHANIKSENCGSKCAFRSAGFHDAVSGDGPYEKGVHYLMELHDGSVD